MRDLQKYGINHLQTSVQYTPEQNKKIERDNRTIVGATRTILFIQRTWIYHWGQKVLIQWYIH